jgi:hypothetical protein
LSRKTISNIKVPGSSKLLGRQKPGFALFQIAQPLPGHLKVEQIEIDGQGFLDDRALLLAQLGGDGVELARDVRVEGDIVAHLHVLGLPPIHKLYTINVYGRKAFTF